MHITAAGLTGLIVTVKDSKNYQLHFRHPQSRKRQRVSLGTSDESTAKARAKHILETTGKAGIAALRDHARRDTTATVGRACDHYLVTSTVTYRRDNVNCLYRVVRAALGTEDGSKARNLPLSRLNARLVSDYLRNAIVSQVTKKSCLASARAVFCRMTDWEGFDGMPDMRAFREAATGTGIRISLDAFQPLPKETLQRIEAGVRKHGGAYLRAYLLSRYCGLRPGEIAGFRKTWIERRGEQYVLCVRQRPYEGFTLKTGNRAERDIGIPADMAADLLACDDYGIPGGTPYMRYHWLLRVFNAYLKEFMPERKQLLYTLRKQAGSDWLAATGKISLVSKLLGHTSAAVTLRHYATYDQTVVMPAGVFGG